MDFKEQVYSVLFISAAEKFNTSVSELLPDYKWRDLYLEIFFG